MNPDESVVDSYLRSCGFNIVFEPDGNVPPDFLVNSTIGVEVRRLNQQHQKGSKSRGLEEQRIPLIKGLNRELSEYKSVSGGKCYAIAFTFARPIPTPNEIKLSLKTGIKEFEAQHETLPFTITFSENCKMVIASEVNFCPQKYRIAMEQDFDSGGWVNGNYIDAINHCMAEKEKTIKNAVNIYGSWWLVLVDHLLSAANFKRLVEKDEEVRIIAKLSKPKCFEKVIILGLEGNSRFEI